MEAERRKDPPGVTTEGLPASPACPRGRGGPCARQQVKGRHGCQAGGLHTDLPAPLRTEAQVLPISRAQEGPGGSGAAWLLSEDPAALAVRGALAEENVRPSCPGWQLRSQPPNSRAENGPAPSGGDGNEGKPGHVRVLGPPGQLRAPFHRVLPTWAQGQRCCPRARLPRVCPVIPAHAPRPCLHLTQRMKVALPFHPRGPHRRLSSKFY